MKMLASTSGPSDIDWTRFYENAVNRDQNITISAGCDAARRATAACPPWREAVLETLPNVVDMIQATAVEMRRMYKMSETAPIVVDLPRRMESRLMKIDYDLIASGYAYVNWID